MATAAPGSSSRAARYNRNRRSELAIWWQEIDRAVLAIVLILMGIGAVAVAAGSPASAKRLSTAHERLPELHFFYLHMRWQLIGLAAMFWASTRTKDSARRIGILMAGAMLFLLVLVPFVGSEVNGARRWIRLGVSIQPSEFLKCGYPILLAWILSWRARDPNIPVVGICFAVMALLGALLMAQPDFGSTMLFGGTFFVLILLSGIPLKRIGMFAGAGLVGIVLMYFTYENGRNRIDNFLFGGTAFDQVDLAERTLLNGGWSGLGFWMGTRKFALPEAHTDYIFSVIGEEFGLIACIVIVLLYLAVLTRILLRLVDEEDLFTVLAASGLAAQFGGQAFINILVNLQLFPSKGMTLPLISYGGSSTVAVCLAMGLLLAITRRNPYIKRERFSLRAIGDNS
ncbi:FtsW/RodA/SpoVE family cell cycle protein [Novosphingobium pentaromativorans]|uniref:Probable peptidoglycan glycosyltransferase FtsW n=1 Tax=Novosphingobium pentaromativorans US6-1 TaxID=1088721 RepID=G6E9X8_9SPHN|nr:putative peptidoglycan glycosyltransferase FtsW [Novosphingobium pentaromativorans]AIT80876.1 cell division protein FtsW [Novosphingobium pentaromativorans US6-1]EHJ61835.1 cell division protein FtsW [Novosphingobium pentaromativorans US6-1]